MLTLEPRKQRPYWAIPFSSYQQVTDFLREIETARILKGQPSDGTVSLGTLARCLHELGRPDLRYRTIHVTGTNGKTTVCRMIAALLQATGMRVGVYTSPHVTHFRERMAVNGCPISEEELVDACNHVKAYMDWKGVQLGSFEFLTAAAFFAFHAAQVEYAVVEVGIGGGQDATNVIAPEVSVVTNVDYDHMDLLGETLEQIAGEKAGVIKPMTPVVCGPMADGPRRIIGSRAVELQAPVLLIGQHYEATGFARNGFGGTCSLRVGQKVWDRIALNSPADFMATNAALALAVYQVLHRRGLVRDITDSELGTLFKDMDLGACCEVFHSAPAVLVNGAQNTPAAAALTSVLRHAFEGRRMVFVLSLGSKKEYAKMIKLLAGAGAERAVFTRWPYEGSVEPEVLASLWRANTHAAAEIVEDPAAAFDRAVEAAGSFGVVVVTGSVQIAGLGRTLAEQSPRGTAKLSPR